MKRGRGEFMFFAAPMNRLPGSTVFNPETDLISVSGFTSTWQIPSKNL